jgi:hypothetical protein
MIMSAKDDDDMGDNELTGAFITFTANYQNS